MRVVISLPLPFDAWGFYAPHITRFCDTFKRFPPGCDYELWAMCNWGEPDDEVIKLFHNIKTRFMPYMRHGCDLGCHQTVANWCDNSFIIGMTSRCYFHRSGWLARMLEARDNNGPGLYGCSASNQSGRLHLCTRAFGLDSELWKKYPRMIDHRSKGPMFEVGTDDVPNIMEFVNTQARTLVVHWDEVFTIPRDVDKYFSCSGRFRDGHQNAMLVHDYHTDMYRDANNEEKRQMSLAMCKLEVKNLYGGPLGT